MNKFFISIIGITIALISVIFFDISHVKAVDSGIIDNWNFNNNTNVWENDVYTIDGINNYSGSITRASSSSDSFSTNNPFNLQNELSLEVFRSYEIKRFDVDNLEMNDVSAGYSISAWLNVVQTDTISRLYLKDVNNNNVAHIPLGDLDFYGHWEDGNCTYYDQNDSITYEDKPYNGERIGYIGTWMFQTAVFHPNYVAFYVDGVLKTKAYYNNAPISYENIKKIEYLMDDTSLGSSYPNYFFDDLTFWNTPLTDDEVMEIYNLNDTVGGDYYITDDAPDDYIMYYGENPAYVELRETISLPFVYNVCDTYTNYDNLKVQIWSTEGEGELMNEKNLVHDFDQCSGTSNINFVSDLVEDTEYYFIKIVNTNANVSYDTNNFMVSEYESIESSNLTFINYNFDTLQSFDIANTATSTTLNFAYNMCENSSFKSATSTKLYLYNLTSNTKTSINSELLTNCSDNINIDFPLATGLIQPQTFTAGIYNETTNDLIYKKDNKVFQISFFNTTPAYVINDYTSTSTDISIFDMNIHDLVCSTSQWESSNILTTSYCNILEKSLNIPVRGLDWAKNEIIRLYNKTLDIPPFKYIFDLKQYWNNAEPQTGINTLLGIKTVKAQSTNINNQITVPDSGQGWTVNFPFVNNDTIEFKLFNEQNIRNFLGNSTVDILRIFGNISILVLTFTYLFTRIRNYNF